MAIEFDDVQFDDVTRPYGAIAKVGPRRWVWAYWSSSKTHWDGQDPTSHGYEASLRAAIKKCGGIETFLRELDVPPISDDFLGVRFNAKEAVEWRSIFAARRRKPNLKASPDVHVTEYVYHNTIYYWDDFGDLHSGHQHRVLKKTAKRIFVERSCHGRVDTRGGISRVPMFSLDRAQLEAGETVYPQHYAGASGFCLSAPEESEPEIAESEIAECFAACSTVAQLKSAYRRLSKKHHPDHGGDPNGFRHLCEQYEKALALLKGE